MCDPEHPKHAQWVTCPVSMLAKNWDVFSFQELCTYPCNVGPCIIIQQHEVMVVDEWHYNGPQDLVTISQLNAQYSALKMPSIKCTYVRCP